MFKVYSVVIVILALFGINFFLAFKNSQAINYPNILLGAESYRESAYILPVVEPNYIPIFDSSIPKPTINAKSAAVFDFSSSRFLYEKNSNIKLPIASLTKVMSAVIVLEKLNLEDIVTIEKESVGVDGEKQDLYLGEKITVRNLLKLMLIQSSNDAAYAIVVHASKKGIDFISEMNTKASLLSMKDTNFIDPAGLDDNAHSTIQDLIKLVEYSLNYREIWDISAEKTAVIESSDEKIKHTAQSTNILIGLIKNFVGGKTGYTEGAGQCMILVTEVPDYPSRIVSIVLGSNDRFGDTQKLVDWTKRAYRWK